MINRSAFSLARACCLLVLIGLLAGCASTMMSSDEGGIAGTGNTVECEKKDKKSSSGCAE